MALQKYYNPQNFKKDYSGYSRGVGAMADAGVQALQIASTAKDQEMEREKRDLEMQALRKKIADSKVDDATAAGAYRSIIDQAKQRLMETNPNMTEREATTLAARVYLPKLKTETANQALERWVKADGAFKGELERVATQTAQKEISSPAQPADRTGDIGTRPDELEMIQKAYNQGKVGIETNPMTQETAAPKMAPPELSTRGMAQAIQTPGKDQPYAPVGTDYAEASQIALQRGVPNDQAEQILAGKQSEATAQALQRGQSPTQVAQGLAEQGVPVKPSEAINAGIQTTRLEQAEKKLTLQQAEQQIKWARQNLQKELAGLKDLNSLDDMVSTQDKVIESLTEAQAQADMNDNKALSAQIKRQLDEANQQKTQIEGYRSRVMKQHYSGKYGTPGAKPTGGKPTGQRKPLSAFDR